MNIHMRSLCIIIVLCVFLSGCLFAAIIKPIPIKTAAEIEEIYYENDTLFQIAVESLAPFGNGDQYIIIRPAGAENSEYNIPVWYYNLPSVTITSTTPLDDVQCLEIQTAAIPLFDALDLPYIAVSSSGVLFQLYDKYGKTAELHYTLPGKQIFTPFATTDELYIDEYWYAVTTSD